MNARTVTYPRFINREPEIDHIKSLLEKVNRGAYFNDWIIEFHGIHGIGKTSLLYEILRICDNSDIPCLKLDFGRGNEEPLLPDEIVVLISQALQAWEPRIVEHTNEQSHELPTSLDAHKGNGGHSTGLIAKISRLAGDIHTFVQTRPLVLMFDTVEKANPEDLEWLEKHLFSKLVADKRTKLLIILAGRLEVRWKQFEVRQHSQSWKLLPFDTNDTGEQLFSLRKEYRNFAKNVHYLTSGHPLNNRTVAGSLFSLQQRGDVISQDNFKNYELEIIQELISQFIDEFVMKTLDSRLREAIRMIAPIRRFDIELLDSFIEKFSLSYEGGFRVLLLQGDMIKSHLVEYNDQRKAFALDPTVRRILTLSMRYSDPENYRKVNEFALEFNTRRQQKTSGTDRNLFALERLYHRANLLLLEGKSSPEIGDLLVSNELKVLESEMTLADAQQLQLELEKDWELEDVLGQGFNIVTDGIDHIVNLKNPS